MSDDEPTVTLGDQEFSRRQVLAALGGATVTGAMGVEAATDQSGQQSIGGGTGLEQLSANYTVDPFVGPSNFPPQDPQAGDLWIQTDSGKRLVYDGSNWGNLPLTTSSVSSDSINTGQIVLQTPNKTKLPRLFWSLRHLMRTYFASWETEVVLRCDSKTYPRPTSRLQSWANSELERQVDVIEIFDDDLNDENEGYMTIHGTTIIRRNWKNEE